MLKVFSVVGILVFAHVSVLRKRYTRIFLKRHPTIIEINNISRKLFQLFVFSKASKKSFTTTF